MMILCIVHSFLLSLICGNKFWRNRVLVSHAALTAFTLGYILYLPFCSLIVSAYLSWFWRRSYISVTLSSLCIPTHLQRLLVFSRLLIALSSYFLANAVISSTLFLSSLFRLVSNSHRIRNQRINSRNDWELSPNEFICLNNLCMDCPLCLLSILFIPRQITEPYKQTSHLAAFLVFNSDQSSSFDSNFCNKNKQTIE